METTQQIPQNTQVIGVVVSLPRDFVIIPYQYVTNHITARGNARQAIYEDDQDRRTFLEYLSKVIKRYECLCHAYCLMDNHYHLLVERQSPTLSKGMKHLNGNYTQAYNKRHNRVGHLFQGRYKGILVDKDNYLLELSRYIALNPVRARMVRSAKDWPWSSYAEAFLYYGAGHAQVNVVITVEENA